MGKAIVLFMSGTGNSARCAQWIAETMRQSLRPVMVAELPLSPGAAKFPRHDLLAVTFPTHGFTLPWLVIKQILGLAPGNGARAIVLPTRAGTRIKGISLPGLEGTAGYLALLLLFFRGYHPAGMLAVDMPSNWTALHWGLNRANAAAIVFAAEPKVQRFVRFILSGQTFFSGKIPLLLGLFLFPVSVAYLIFARFFLAKLFFASADCNGCGLCVDVCRQQAVHMAGKIPRPYWTYSCESCMACMNRCPRRAIESSPILAILFYYSCMVPAGAYILHFLGNMDWAGSWFVLLLQYIYMLSVIWLLSFLVHKLLQYPMVSCLLGRFSHTRYFRRYQIPPVEREK